ncbi:MAG: hypothetical protein WD597_01775, partial [Balneolaceae bacterium]
LKLVFAAVIICFSAQAVQAQTLGALHTSSDLEINEYTIEKGTDLEPVLEIVEQRFNVVFLYRSNAIEDVKVLKQTTLSENIPETLELLLEDTGL